MTENNPLKKISLLNPIHLLAVGFGSGLIYPAPGTWGSLAGTILGVILLSLLGVKIFLIFTALCFLLGCYLCQKPQQIWACTIMVLSSGMNLSVYLLY